MAMKECVGAAEAGVRKTAGPGGEGEEVSRRCSADRPCRHNQWIKIRKLSKNVTSLRCQVCATTWFTELQKHTKCRDFYAGRCLAADTCASPHIVTRGTTGKSSLKAELDVVKGHKKQDTKPSRAACGKSEAEPEAESCGAGSGRSSEEVSEAPTPLRDAAPKKPAGGCCSKNARFQASLQAYMTGPKAAQVPLIQDGAPNMDGWPTCSGGCQSNAACSSGGVPMLGQREDGLPPLVDGDGSDDEVCLPVLLNGYSSDEDGTPNMGLAPQLLHLATQQKRIC
eukprot:gene458-670_t